MKIGEFLREEGLTARPGAHYEGIDIFRKNEKICHLPTVEIWVNDTHEKTINLIKSKI